LKSLLIPALLISSSSRDQDLLKHIQLTKSEITLRKMCFTGLNQIKVMEGRRSVPIVKQAPIVSSASIAWDGVLLEEHSVTSQETAMRHAPVAILHLQTGAPARHEWRSAGKLHRTFITTGSIHLLPPGPERSLANRDPTDAIVLSIEPAFLNRVVEDSLPNGRFELVERFAFEDGQIERLIRALHAEARVGAPTGKLFGQSLANTLAIYLAERYSASPPRFEQLRGGMPKARLNRLLEYISAKLDEDLSLQALAEIAGMNYYYFARLFKQSMGLSPHRYILKQRIERAKELLRISGMTVLEASVRTGFVDQAHFAKVFRRVVGVRPTQYRAHITHL
jgi:AraC family transcriptional regulator